MTTTRVQDPKTGVAGTESLGALLGRLPDLAGERAPVMTAIETWLTSLYGEPGWTCAALRPDPLHEHLVANEVAADPYLLHPVVPDLTERQACELLYVLSRATMVNRVSGRAVAGVVHDLVQRFPDRLVTPARIVAPQVETSAARVLRRAVTAAEAADLADDRTRQQRLSDAVATVTNLPSALRRLLFRRRRDGSLARTASSREPIAGPSPVPAVAGSAAATPLRRIADAVTLAAHRAAHRTAASAFGQAVQQYHEAARRGGAVVAAAALPALLALHGSGSPPAGIAAPPPVAPSRAPAPAPSSTGQAATATPAAAPSATVPPGAVPSTGVPPTGPPPGRRSTSAGAAPVTPNSALPPADGKHPVTVDASALSTSRFAVIGVTGPVDSRSRQELRMAPGRYRLTTNGSPSDAWFTVTAAGTVEYDAGITYLGGRGTATLVVRGLLVIVDARQLTASTFAVTDVIQNADKRVPHALRMLPGRYRLATVSCWSDAYFTLAPAGTVDYDAGITYLGGRGTPTLTVHGLSVTIDARQLTAPTFSVQCVVSGADRSAPRELRVLPNRYGIAAGTQWSTVGFTMTAAGTVTYDAAGNPYLSGKGGTTVTVRTATLPPS